MKELGLRETTIADEIWGLEGFERDLGTVMKREDNGVFKSKLEGICGK